MHEFERAAMQGPQSRYRDHKANPVERLITVAALGPVILSDPSFEVDQISRMLKKNESRSGSSQKAKQPRETTAWPQQQRHHPSVVSPSPR